MNLGAPQMETLALFSRSKVSSTEAMVDPGCDHRGLVALMARHRFLLGADASPLQPPPPADARHIFNFISGNADRFQIVPAQLGAMLAQQRRAGLEPKLDNAGDMAAVSVHERRRELKGDRLPVLVVFEDSEVPLRFAQKDAHLLTTYGLLVAMELAGHLLSAREAFERTVI